MLNRYSVLLLFFLLSHALAQGNGVLGDYIVTETRPFGDGNRLEHTSVGDFAYDDAGRSYLRFSDVIIISNPVESAYWQVDVPSGVAYRHEPLAPQVETSLTASEPEVPGMDWPEFGDQFVSMLELGSRTVDGIRSTGRRWEYTIPAGAIGNADPIPVEAEMWLSDDFGFTIPVEIVTRDDLNGEHRRMLRNLRSATFEPADFRPDDRYRITDAPGVRDNLGFQIAEETIDIESEQ